MQDFPLTIQHIMWRIEKLVHRKEIVTQRENGVHRYTYGEFATRVHQLAAALHRLGVRPGDRVATLAWNNYRHMELYYAVPCMGAVLHTVNLRLFPDLLEFVIRDAEDQVVVVDRTLLPQIERLAGKLPTVRNIVVMRDETEPAAGESPLGEILDYETLISGESSSYAWPELDERTAAAMCYTSGTTGNPKGVVYSHRSNVLHTMAILQKGVLGLDESDAVLPVVPLFHANAWGLPYATGIVGAKMILPDRWMGDGQTLINLATTEGATILAGVPTIWINLLQQIEKTGAKLPKVHTVLCGGAALPPSLWDAMERNGLHMLHAWGMTETSPLGTSATPRTWHAPEDHRRVRLTQGAPAPGIEIRISDLVSREILPWDGTTFGELEVRGPWVATGYHNQTDSDRISDDGWFRTGDMAVIDADGFMTIVDRAKDVIKSGGEWISSVELENAIMANPKVAEAAVIGLPHPKWSERPVGYVVARDEYRGTLSAQDILDDLETRVARWWLPDEIRFIDQIPKTSVGKFDKKALRASAEPIRVTGDGV